MLIPEMWKFHVGIAVEHLIFLVVLIAKSLYTPRCVLDSALNCHTCLIHLRRAGPQIRLPFEFSSLTVSGTSPLHLARLCFPSWCVLVLIGSERRLI